MWPKRRWSERDKSPQPKTFSALNPPGEDTEEEHILHCVPMQEHEIPYTNVNEYVGARSPMPSNAAGSSHTGHEQLSAEPDPQTDDHMHDKS